MSNIKCQMSNAKYSFLTPRAEVCRPIRTDISSNYPIVRTLLQTKRFEKNYYSSYWSKLSVNKIPIHINNLVSEKIIGHNSPTLWQHVHCCTDFYLNAIHQHPIGIKN